MHLQLFIAGRDGGLSDGARDPEALPAAQVSHARILVAEDEEAVRNLILRVMRAEGYSVEVCADGQEAFERLRDELPGQPSALAALDAALHDLEQVGIDGNRSGIVKILVGNRCPVNFRFMYTNQHMLKPHPCLPQVRQI